MENDSIAAEWFQFAKSDLDTAKFLLQMHPMPTEIICYHCQQSAEKYLKGYISFHGQSLLKTHDLTRLNILCKEYDSSFSDIDDDCIELTDYGVTVRYPFHLDLQDSDVTHAIKSAESIASFVQSKI
jgi:HEPN domain-containing protein